MKTLATLFASLLVAVPAAAIEMDFNIEDMELIQNINIEGEDRDHHGGGHKHKKMCGDLNFSPVQKTAYRQARKAMAAAAKPLRQQLKNDRQQYKAFLMNTKVPADHAEFIADRMNQTRSQLRTHRSDFFHAIVYDIASVDQRAPLLKCVRKMAKHMKKKKMKKLCKGKKAKPGPSHPADPAPTN